MRRQAADRKAEIVDIAIGLADKVGPDRITTDMIAAQIGITQAAIFRHFPKKDDIWNAAALYLTGRLRQAWDNLSVDNADPVARLEAVVIGHLKLIRGMPALPAILFSRELHAKNTLLRTTLLGAMGSFQRRLTGLIEEAIAAGRFRDDLVAEDAAMLLIGLIQSLALRWSLSGRSDDLVATGERLLAVQFAGLLAVPAGSRSAADEGDKA